MNLEWPELPRPCDVHGCEHVAMKGRNFCKAHELPGDRPSIECQGCQTRLREPARFCGFCTVELSEAA